jgi:hypothetical protein
VPEATLHRFPHPSFYEDTFTAIAALILPMLFVACQIFSVISIIKVSKIFHDKLDLQCTPVVPKLFFVDGTPIPNDFFWWNPSNEKGQKLKCQKNIYCQFYKSHGTFEDSHGIQGFRGTPFRITDVMRLEWEFDPY